MLSFLNDATKYSGPRLTLTHPALDVQFAAYGRPVAGVLSAMCLQMVARISEGVPARRCANEGCGQWFYTQQGRAVHGQYRTSEVLYCSNECAKAQSQRNYRRRQPRSSGKRGAGGL
jgi:hypothetical protein